MDMINRGKGRKNHRPIGEIRMFSRSIVSSGLATTADFLLFSFLVEMASFHPAVATFLGCILGGFINFLVNKYWAFPGNNGSMLTQGWRYVVVSGTSALLNSAGVGLLLLLPISDYRIAWIVARVVVYSGWNYPLQRGFVFPAERGASK